MCQACLPGQYSDVSGKERAPCRLLPDTKRCHCRARVDLHLRPGLAQAADVSGVAIAGRVSAMPSRHVLVKLGLGDMQEVWTRDGIPTRS
jgi:hypothetical protein